MYSPELLELFSAPRHRDLELRADRSAHEENPVCGDRLTLRAELENQTIVRMTFQGQGCPPTLAAAEWLCRWATGKTVGQLAELGADEITAGLGGIPRNKQHAVGLCLQALMGICREQAQSV